MQGRTREGGVSRGIFQTSILVFRGPRNPAAQTTRDPESDREMQGHGDQGGLRVPGVESQQFPDDPPKRSHRPTAGVSQQQGRDTGAVRQTWRQCCQPGLLLPAKLPLKTQSEYRLFQAKENRKQTSAY